MMAVSPYCRPTHTRDHRRKTGSGHPATLTHSAAVAQGVHARWCSLEQQTHPVDTVHLCPACQQLPHNAHVSLSGCEVQGCGALLKSGEQVHGV
jgi:hypothetical protein